jgi:hypothetical protein
MAALFSAMVIQQANMALMFLGKVPHPQTGELVQELDSARVFIDQLEMLEAKTRGNLSPHETKLLKDTLMSVRLQFVEAAESESAKAPQAASAPPSSEPGAAQSASGQTVTAAPGTAEEESRKKFTKKY